MKFMKYVELDLIENWTNESKENKGRTVGAKNLMKITKKNTSLFQLIN